MIISVFDRVENIVGKWEITFTNNFSFFPQYFQKAYFPDPSKGVIVWEWVNPLPNDKMIEWPNFKAFVDNN